MSRSANWAMEWSDEKSVTIRDLGPWDQHPTITNDAENVVKSLAPSLKGRRLFYYDSEGEITELLVKDGAFAGFR